MRRSELLQAMAAALPPSTIRFDASVEGVREDASGACGWRPPVPAMQLAAPPYDMWAGARLLRLTHHLLLIQT